MRKLAAAVCAIVLAGCGAEDGDAPAGAGLVQRDAPTGHVHAVGIDPKDGSVLVAAHTGLFRAAAGERRARRISDERRDVMGFTVEGPGRYAGSGHPDIRDGGPSSVGFIRSADGGRSWTTVSLSGEADLHVLEVAPGRVYGYDALSGRFVRSIDGGRSWRRTALPPILDLAVDPANPDHLVASGEEQLLRSTDGGRTWRPAASAPASHLRWTSDGLLLLGYDGVLRRAADAGRRPEAIGDLPGVPAAATGADRQVLMATDDGSVFVSDDAGGTWNRRLEPAVE